MTEFGEWCAGQGMPLSYHHHMAAVIETEPELDAFMRHSGAGIPLLLRCGPSGVRGRRRAARHRQPPCAHHPCAREGRPDGRGRCARPHEAVVPRCGGARGVFTVPGDGSLDFGAIVQKFADYGYEGWFVVEAEQDPKKNPPLKMAQVGHKELMRVMTAAGYTVETQGFPDVTGPLQSSGPMAAASSASHLRRERWLDLCRVRAGRAVAAGQSVTAADRRSRSLPRLRLGQGRGHGRRQGFRRTRRANEPVRWTAGRGLCAGRSTTWRVDRDDAAGARGVPAPGRRRLSGASDRRAGADSTRGKGTQHPLRHQHPARDGTGADSLLVVEVITPAGHSSSYPPHKHDTDNLPHESFLEETYYHRLNPQQGFAFQRVYTDDRTLDESMAVEDGDVVLVPRGYHPVRGGARLRPLLSQRDGRPHADLEVPQRRRTRMDVEMRAIYCVAPEKLELREAPRPELKPGWVRVGIKPHRHLRHRLPHLRGHLSVLRVSAHHRPRAVGRRAGRQRHRPQGRRGGGHQSLPQLRPVPGLPRGQDQLLRDPQGHRRPRRRRHGR